MGQERLFHLEKKDKMLHVEIIQTMSRGMCYSHFGNGVIGLFLLYQGIFLIYYELNPKLEKILITCLLAMTKK